MTITPPLSTCLPRAEGKAALLADFIMSQMPAAGSDTAVTPGCITLVARSSESPIAQAVVLAGADLAAAGIRVRVVFTAVGGDAWTDANSTLPFARDIRWAKNPRYIDAHEQLVLGAKATWIGDCMRRDPAKRDAFDQAKTNCSWASI
jgi:hypothetical protein